MAVIDQIGLISACAAVQEGSVLSANRSSR